MPNKPTLGIKVSHWTRRVTYMFLWLVCAGSTLCYSVAAWPASLCGESAGDLTFFYQHLQFFAGVLFVSVVALSGMLIEDYSGRLPATIRLLPEITVNARRFRYWLTVVMFVLNVIVVMAL